MKSFLLSSLSLLFMQVSQAQTGPVNALPAGKYETITKDNNNKWERGDIILLDDNKYKISTSEEVGEYKFSVTTQRIFFTTGPLKLVFAKISAEPNGPAIVIPKMENEQKGVRIASADVWGVYHH